MSLPLLVDVDPPVNPFCWIGSPSMRMAAGSCWTIARPQRCESELSTSLKIPSTIKAIAPKIATTMATEMKTTIQMKRALLLGFLGVVSTMRQLRKGSPGPLVGGKPS